MRYSTVLTIFGLSLFSEIKLSAQFAPGPSAFNYAVANTTITSGTLPFAGSGSATIAFSQGNLFTYNIGGAQLTPALEIYTYSKTGANTGSLVVTRTNISPTFTATQIWTFTSPTTGTFATSGTYNGYTGSAQGTFTITYLQPVSGAIVPADRLINVSTRGFVGTGGQSLIGGFVVSGTSTETVLIRGDGPALAGFGVSGSLISPQLILFDSSGIAIATNTGWGNPSAIGASTVQATIQAATPFDFSSVGAFALTSGSADCAMVAVLPPGAYTVQVSGVGNTTGIGLVEAYEIP